MAQDDKTIENLERDRWQDKEVDRRDTVGMVAEKRPPALRGTLPWRRFQQIPYLAASASVRRLASMILTRACVYRKLDSAILVMKYAEDRL